MTGCAPCRISPTTNEFVQFLTYDVIILNTEFKTEISTFILIRKAELNILLSKYSWFSAYIFQPEVKVLITYCHSSACTQQRDMRRAVALFKCLSQLLTA